MLQSSGQQLAFSTVSTGTILSPPQRTITWRRRYYYGDAKIKIDGITEYVFLRWYMEERRASSNAELHLGREEEKAG